MCVCVGGGEPGLRPTLAIAESYQRGTLLIEVLSTMVIRLLQVVRCDFKPWLRLHITLAVDGNSKTHIDILTHTRTPSDVRPIPQERFPQTFH